ncbi:hypothetical protein, partial [Enterocloster clostridioformis]
CCYKNLFSASASTKPGLAGFYPYWNQDCELVSQLPNKQYLAVVRGRYYRQLCVREKKTFMVAGSLPQ